MNMNMEINTLIIGAGAGGLGAACWLKEKKIPFLVVEQSGKLPNNMHNGVHYLHSCPYLPFNTDLRKTTLTDGVLRNGKIFHKPGLLDALEYSEKVREIQHPSSIFQVGENDTVWMPKGNSLNDLMNDMHNFAGSDNFAFDYTLEHIDVDNKIAKFRCKNGLESVEVSYQNLISTVPLDKMKAILPTIESLQSLELKFSPVHITNFKVEKIVPNWLINLYIPDKTSPLYRASILNGVCSVESIHPLSEDEKVKARMTLSMFHFTGEYPDTYSWDTGKVMSISINDRSVLVDELARHNIYSIGRFGLWNRKLLVDSTIEQARVVAGFIAKEETWEFIKHELI